MVVISIPAWLIIALVTIAVAAGMTKLTTSEGMRWFNRLRRPAWLTFERAIPFIWITIFICCAWSATLVWNSAPDRAFPFMAGYLLLEVVTLAYSPVMMNQRSLRIGTIVGATGGLIAALLAVSIWPISQTATYLLIPYLLWSPIGTYTTWAMAQLNPRDV
jgi:translocator protein